jgi:hypothetical protein
MSSLLVFLFGVGSNFVGSEIGQKQRVKLLQNMSICLLWEGGGRGGGGQREGKGATVHKRGRKYQHY